jgi:hypothetical protein
VRCWGRVSTSFNGISAFAHAADTCAVVPNSRRMRSIWDDGAMPGFNGVTVDAPEGQRWELALTLIGSGEAPVRLGDVKIWRSTAGPNADGVIRMTVAVGERVDRDVAQTALLHGRRVADEATSADPRFGRLLDQYGCRWEIVHDYGTGSVLLAEADRHGNLVWQS